jgi:hypothetical protein
LDLHATLFAFLLAIALFGSMLLFLGLGWRFGVRQMAKHGTLRVRELGKADAPVYALFGLLLGFTFSGASARFDRRSDLAAQQVNAIGTGWSRIDVLPPEVQQPVRAGFQAYAVAGGARRNWMYMIGSAATVAVAMYVIIALEYPRLGLLRADAIDHALVELRTTVR